MINELLNRYSSLCECKEDIEKAAKAIIECYENGGKLLLCGNGGSCADCEHIVGEMMKGFLKKRPLNDSKKAEMKSKCDLVDDELLSKLQCGLPAVAIPSINALNSAFCNDVDPELVYAQPLMSLAKENDILIGISTSGNSKNVFGAVIFCTIGASSFGIQLKFKYGVTTEINIETVIKIPNIKKKIL